MKTVSKQILTGLGITLLLATTSVQAMAPNRREEDKPKTPVKPQVVKSPVGSPAGSATKAAASLWVWKHQNAARFEMPKIAIRHQKGTKVITAPDSWEITTNGQHNQRDIVPDDARYQIEATLEVSAYPWVKITGEIEWLFGAGPVFWGVIHSETSLWKRTPDGEFYSNHIQPPHGVTPNIEVEAARKAGRKAITPFSFMVAPNEADVIFIAGNIKDTPAQYTVRNLRICAPEDVSNDLQPFISNSGVLAKARDALIAKNMGELESNYMDNVTKALGHETTAKEGWLRTNPALIGIRANNAGHKEAFGNDDSKKGLSPGKPSVTPIKAAAPGMAAAGAGAGKPTPPPLATPQKATTHGAMAGAGGAAGTSSPAKPVKTAAPGTVVAGVGKSTPPAIPPKLKTPVPGAMAAAKPNGQQPQAGAPQAVGATKK